MRPCHEAGYDIYRHHRCCCCCWPLAYGYSKDDAWPRRYSSYIPLDRNRSKVESLVIRTCMRLDLDRAACYNTGFVLRVLFVHLAALVSAADEIPKPCVFVKHFRVFRPFLLDSAVRRTLEYQVRCICWPFACLLQSAFIIIP